MQNKRDSLLVVATILVILLLTVGICLFGFSQISRLLFTERGTNLSVLLEKITQNIDGRMEIRREDSQFCARNLCYDTKKTKAELFEKIAEIQSCLDLGENSVLIFDSEGTCYSSDGLSFRWPDASSLALEDSSVYVSPKELLWKKVDQIFFITRLPKNISVEGKTYTHVSIVCDMAEFDRYFMFSSYSDRDFTFIINRNGTQVYHPENSGELGKIYNIVSFLKFLNYKYKTNFENFYSDMTNNRSGFVGVMYNDEPYFVVYHKMQEKDWYALFLTPERLVGVNSVHFMGDVVFYISIVAFLIFGMLVVLIVATNKRMREKQALINKSLQNAVKAEHSASLAKTRFLSSMSHDIRTPMNAIIGMTTIALKNLEDQEHIKSCLSKIALSGNHLLALINDILDISKIESGKMVLTPIVFSIADTLENLANIVRPQVKAKNLDFDIHIRKMEHEYLFADELRLNQIFINLLSNSVKYTPKGGRISLDVSESPVANNEGAVRLTYIVQDNGIGMSKEFQKSMYEIFSRAKDNKIDKIQGSGLGLSITKQMVDLMGGTIECESEEGVGTKFTVSIVVAIAEKMMDDLVIPETSVLLVDDDALFLETAEDTLSSMGMTVETVENGKDAIELVNSHHLKKNDYNIVIIDWKMPEMDGIETTREIRKLVGNDVPIILISAYDWAGIEEEAKAAGADGFISKPFFRSNVYYEFAKVLNIEGSNASVSEDNAEDLKGMNVLVAEDIEVNWEVISEIFDMYGINTEHAENGKECINKLFSAEKAHYDFILMDVQMPVMDGRTATRAIRDYPDPEINSIPIIAMTADAFAEDISECLKAGMDGHVSKPVDMEQLFQEIRRVLRLKKKWGGGDEN